MACHGSLRGRGARIRAAALPLAQPSPEREGFILAECRQYPHSPQSPHRFGAIRRGPGGKGGSSAAYPILISKGPEVLRPSIGEGRTRTKGTKMQRPIGCLCGVSCRPRFARNGFEPETGDFWGESSLGRLLDEGPLGRRPGPPAGSGLGRKSDGSSDGLERDAGNLNSDAFQRPARRAFGRQA